MRYVENNPVVAGMGIAGKIDLAPGEDLILTRPKVGYMLNLEREKALILKVQKARDSVARVAFIAMAGNT